MKVAEAFILTGGKSSRMGSDKAMLALGGKTFVEMIAGELRKAGFENISLVGELEAAELAELAAKCGLNLLPDIKIENADNSRASIIGLYSALKHSTSDWVFVIACDLPLINAEFTKSLESEITDSVDAIIPVQPDGRYQPFCAFYKKENVLNAIEDVIKSNNWKMTNLLSRLNTKYVKFTPETAAPLFNVNTPEDLEAAIDLTKNRLP